MINKLINMKVTPISAKSGNIVVEKPAKNGKFTIEDYASAFINGMDNNQKERFKRMLENGINCGESVAYNYGIDPTNNLFGA